MPANTKTIKTDVEGNPMPQGFNDAIDDYEYQGMIGNSALMTRGRVYQVGSSASTTSIPLLTSTGLPIVLTSAVQTQFAGASIKIAISGQECEAVVTAVSSSGTLTLDSALPSAPSQGTKLVIVPPEQTQLAGGLVTDEVLLNDVSATGAGTEISVGGNAKIEVEVYGAGTGYSLVAQLIMTNGSGQPVSTQAFSLVSQSMVQNITENGGYEIDCAGWDKVLLNVETAPTGGTISASGKLVASA